MPNELRDPHDPVIPGEHVPSPEGHGGVSMPIGQSNPGFDPHEPVLPEGMKATEARHVEDHPEYGPDGKVVPPPIVAQAQIAIDQRKAAEPSAADLDAIEAEKDIADSTAKAESAKGRVPKRS